MRRRATLDPKDPHGPCKRHAFNGYGGMCSRCGKAKEIKMPKKKVTRSRMLFGKVAPSVFAETGATWTARAGKLQQRCDVNDNGPRWEAVCDGTSIGASYDTFATAKRGLERYIANMGKTAIAFGWEPGK